MADTLTASLGLTKPQNFGSADTWGPKLNSDFDLIDAEHTNASKSLRKLTPANDRLPYFTGSGNASGALATFTAIGRTILACADAAAVRAALSLVVGTNVQAYHAFLSTISGYASIANLTALVGLSGAADKIAYFTGAGAFALADFTSFARTLVAAANAAAAATVLGLGLANNVQHARLIASNTNVATATSTDHGIQIGPDSGSNSLVGSVDRWQARDGTGVAATLFLNPGGGSVTIGSTANPAVVAVRGRFQLSSTGAVTVASSAVTIDCSHHTVVGSGVNLDIINGTYANGDLLLLRGTSGSTVTVRDTSVGGGANIELAGGVSFLLDNARDVLLLVAVSSSLWTEVSRSAT